MDKTFILSLTSPFLLGILAGSTTCSCLVGGFLISTSKSWVNFKSHLFFNLARVIGFSLLGLILGLVGNFFNLFSSFFPIVVTIISLFMIYLALPMVGINLPKIKFFKFNYKNKYPPFLFGILTILIPCGFTLTAESLAILSLSPIKGFLIMLFFVFGTIPSLLIIGFLSSKINSCSNFSKIFSFITGLLIIVFSLYTLKTQFINPPKILADETTITNGKQIIEMTVLNSSYEPNYFKVKTNIPIVWQITNQSFGSCSSNLIISPLFFGNPINISSSKIITKEFIIVNPGIYKFSCSMGMVSGIIEASN